MKILYAEDERQLSSAVTEILKIEGFEVTAVYDGQQAWEYIQKEYFDAVVLDIMMPIMDGIQVLEYMRLNEIFTPVLMLTAKSTVNDRIDGLSNGADDYLSKPFAMRELVARLHSMIRRSSEYRHSVLKSGNITLDTASGELQSDTVSLRLSNSETELLAVLLKNKNTRYTSTDINKLVWNGKKDESTAELYIAYLKNKLSRINSQENILSDTNGYYFGD
ncbi:MAG: response regulator transcription factor [Clostridia bacterium]|nr:response regulator transcription factor [Clostridia bacterium]